MSGKSVAKLAFACFLSSCYYSPAPIVVMTPAGPPAGSSGGTGGGGGEGGPGSSTTTVVGNCYYTVTNNQGNISEKCRYSLINPSCTTYVAQCTSNPPSLKCSTTAPVPTCP
jgi:hypothetical protein